MLPGHDKAPKGWSYLEASSITTSSSSVGAVGATDERPPHSKQGSYQPILVR